VKDLAVIAGKADFSIQSPSRVTREEWKAYYKSDRWASLRAEARAVLSYRCVRCGRSHGLHLHHRHYLSFGSETLDDVEWLCAWCHRRRHGKTRRKRT
jgi:DNA-directed RNA polymerase subunit RPC12/RpoP